MLSSRCAFWTIFCVDTLVQIRNKRCPGIQIQATNISSLFFIKYIKQKTNLCLIWLWICPSFDMFIWNCPIQLKKYNWELASILICSFLFSFSFFSKLPISTSWYSDKSTNLFTKFHFNHQWWFRPLHSRMSSRPRGTLQIRLSIIRQRKRVDLVVEIWS